MRSEPKIGRCSHPSSPRAGSTTSTPSLTSPKPSRLSSTVTHKARSKTSCPGDSERRQPQVLRGSSKRLPLTGWKMKSNGDHLFDASMPCSRLTFWSRAGNAKSATNATTATSFPASIKDSTRRGLRSFHSRRSATAALRIDRSNAIRSVDDRRDKSSNSPHQKASLILCMPGHSLQRF